MLLTGKANYIHGTHLHDYQRLILQRFLSLCGCPSSRNIWNYFTLSKCILLHKELKHTHTHTQYAQPG